MARSPGVAIVLAALVLFTMFAAAAPPKLRVVATLPDLYVITKALVGDAAGVEVIARFGQNPHDLEVRPSHMLMLRRADLLVRNGLEEDAWIDVIALGSNNPKMVRGTPTVIEASIGIAVLKTPSGRVDRSFGDVHPL
ncbi:MAG: ABC transporter substrate-binding protein, partial [Candidatus Rokuibacteriota bacterium]